MATPHPTSSTSTASAAASGRIWLRQRRRRDCRQLHATARQVHGLAPDDRDRYPPGRRLCRLRLGGGFVQGYLGYGSDDHEITAGAWWISWSAKPTVDHGWPAPRPAICSRWAACASGPVVALDYAKAKVDGYTEDGDAALTLNVGSVSAKSFTGGIGAELRGDFDTGGVSVRPWDLSAMLEKELGDNDRVVRFSQTTAPGNCQQLVRGRRFGRRLWPAFGRRQRGDPEPGNSQTPYCRRRSAATTAMTFPHRSA